MMQELVRYSRVLEIVGDILKVQVPETQRGGGAAVRFGDLAVLKSTTGGSSLAQVISINRDMVSLQVFKH